MKQSLSEPVSTVGLEERVNERMGMLMDKIDELNERASMVRKKVEAKMRLKEGERLKLSFFRKMKTQCNQEEVVVLTNEKKEWTQKTKMKQTK